MLGLPKKQEAQKLLSDEIPNAQRLARQRGTNCEGFHLYFQRGEREVKFFAKRGFMRGIPLEDVQSDYSFLKKHFGTIVPNQAFFNDPDGNIVAICSPIMIKTDIFDEHNKSYIIEILKQNPALQKQIEFFIQKYERISLE